MPVQVLKFFSPFLTVVLMTILCVTRITLMGLRLFWLALVENCKCGVFTCSFGAEERIGVTRML